MRNELCQTHFNNFVEGRGEGEVEELFLEVRGLMGKGWSMFGGGGGGSRFLDIAIINFIS